MMKRYRVEPRFKKSIIECEFFKHPTEKGTVEVDVCWRGGEYFVDIDQENEDEVEMMQDAIDHPDETFEVTSFENWELDNTFDGCSEDMYYHGVDFDEDEFTEEYYESDMGSWEFLVEERGWESFDCEIYIHNGVKIEEVEV